MNARQSKRIKRLSKRQEKQAAADVGGSLQAASGAARLGGGGDVRVRGEMRIECKVTEKQSYALKLTELEKLKKQAVKCLEQPVFQFAFKSGNRLDRYAAIPTKSWGGTSVTVLSTDKKQIELTQAALAGTLRANKSKLFVQFVNPGNSLNHKTSVFEVVDWTDFLERSKES